MSGPLTAGEPLVPHPAPEPQQPGPPQPPRRRGPGRATRILRRIAGFFVGLCLLAVVAAGVVGFTIYHHYSADLPSVDVLRHYQPKVMSRVYADNGQLIAELATERRIYVPYTAIPPIVRNAFISAEDRNFWTHPGVDPVAILRAGLTDLMQMGEGRRPIGASTITQQVARNILLNNNKVSLARKLREAILAMRMTQAMSRKHILDIYLNEIYLGLSSYGVAAAAEAYFNKPLDQLDIAQAAFLGGLPKAPNNYNPFRDPRAAKARRDWVLDRMAEDRYITAAQATAAKAEPIDASPFHRPETVAGSQWFGEEVRRQLISQFGSDAATEGGLFVRTSLDPKLQREAERALHDGLMIYDRRHGGWNGPVGHLDTTGTGWPAALAQMAQPPGMLRDWRLAVVLSETDREATLGWVVTDPAKPNAPPVSHTGTLSVSAVSWARQARDGKLVGPVPRRMEQVMKPGDLVMVQPEPAATGPKGKPELAHVVLRQIPKVQGAMVSLDPRTGRVLAIVGGWSFAQSQFDRATQAERQPGSSFKPIVYLTALEHGVSPSQDFLDAPFVLNMGAAGVWRPGNYEGTFSGPTPLRIALEKSLNLVTIRVAAHVGMKAVAETAKAFHVVDKMPLVLPAALGAVDTTVLRQAGAYAGFAEEGKEVIPSFIDSVQDRDGHVIWRPNPLSCDGCDDASKPPTIVDNRQQVADPQSTFQLVKMMEGVVRHGTGVAAGRGLDYNIAGKTGTTQDWQDAWFAGFTPDLVTVVWVGYDQPKTLGEGEQAATVAAPIWHDFMAQALKGHPKLSFPTPPGVTMASWSSGYGTRTDAFKPGQVPGASSGSVTAEGAGGSAGGPPTDSASAGASAGIDSGMGGLY